MKSLKLDILSEVSGGSSGYKPSYTEKPLGKFKNGSFSVGKKEAKNAMDYQFGKEVKKSAGNSSFNMKKEAGKYTSMSKMINGMK
ncbi:hypothetical protein [Vibrio sp.]|uniref:hypothetical protein n=1 Tax=Vibrio sp. TaxID=678 RepID=UPI00311D4E99